MQEHLGELGTIAQRWFEVVRGCGDDVRELLHDSHPTACVGDAAFAYVNGFRAHVNVGFFRSAEFADPTGLLLLTLRAPRPVPRPVRLSGAQNTTLRLPQLHEPQVAISITRPKSPDITQRNTLFSTRYG